MFLETLMCLLLKKEKGGMPSSSLTRLPEVLRPQRVEQRSPRQTAASASRTRFNVPAVLPMTFFRNTLGSNGGSRFTQRPSTTQTGDSAIRMSGGKRLSLLGVKRSPRTVATTARVTPVLHSAPRVATTPRVFEPLSSDELDFMDDHCHEDECTTTTLMDPVQEARAPSVGVGTKSNVPRPPPRGAAMSGTYCRYVAQEISSVENKVVQVTMQRSLRQRVEETNPLPSLPSASGPTLASFAGNVATPAPKPSKTSPAAAAAVPLLTAEDIDNWIPDMTSTGSSRDYHLVKTLFSLAMLHNSGATKIMRSIGTQEIERRMQGRYGSRRLNKDDFYHELCEILVGHVVERHDTDMLFDMFDTNGSGVVDEGEFLSGMKMTQQDHSRSIVSYCKRITELRSAVGAVITMMEAKIMLDAMCEVCHLRFPGIVNDAKRVLEILLPQSHHSQVPLHTFRQCVTSLPSLDAALQALSADATLPPPPPPVPSPDPERDIADVAASAAAQFKTDSMAEDGEASPSRNRSRGITPAAAVNNAAARGKGVDVPFKPNGAGGASRNSLDEQEDGGGGTDGSGGTKKPSANATPDLSNLTPQDARHPKFRADLHMRKGQELEEHPLEPDRPVWYLRDGVVWRSSDTSAPLPIIG